MLMKSSMRRMPAFRSVLLIVLVSLALILPVSMAEEMTLSRLDDDGYLYFMDYTGDYYSPRVIDTLRSVGYVDPGCSSFFTYNLDGEPITCRNYDFPHRVIGDDQTITGLNIVLHCKPEGKYESIAVADAVWCDQNDPMLRNGGPDTERISLAGWVSHPACCCALCWTIVPVWRKPSPRWTQPSLRRRTGKAAIFS